MKGRNEGGVPAPSRSLYPSRAAEEIRRNLLGRAGFGGSVSYPLVMMAACSGWRRSPTSCAKWSRHRRADTLQPRRCPPDGSRRGGRASRSPGPKVLFARRAVDGNGWRNGSDSILPEQWFARALWLFGVRSAARAADQREARRSYPRRRRNSGTVPSRSDQAVVVTRGATADPAAETVLLRTARKGEMRNLRAETERVPLPRPPTRPKAAPPHTETGTCAPGPAASRPKARSANPPKRSRSCFRPSSLSSSRPFDAARTAGTPRVPRRLPVRRPHRARPRRRR